MPRTYISNFVLKTFYFLNFKENFVFIFFPRILFISFQLKKDTTNSKNSRNHISKKKFFLPGLEEHEIFSKKNKVKTTNKSSPIYISNTCTICKVTKCLIQQYFCLIAYSFNMEKTQIIKQNQS